jgi:ribonucleoside-diphosphate reductase alpha chain
MPRRVCITQKFTIRGQQADVSGFLLMDEDLNGNLIELNVELNKEGSMVRAMIHAFANSVNIGIEKGVPLSLYINEFKDWRFEPSGQVIGSINVDNCSSVVDYIAKELEAIYLKRKEEVCNENA